MFEPKITWNENAARWRDACYSAKRVASLWRDLYFQQRKQCEAKDAQIDTLQRKVEQLEEALASSINHIH